VVTRGLIGVHPDAKDHMQSSEYTGKGPDANGPVAIGLMTQDPRCTESVCNRSGFKSSHKKSSGERSGLKKMACELQMY
jgi:hypothetical protein